MHSFECPKCKTFMEMEEVKPGKWQLYCRICGYDISGDVFSERDIEEMERIMETVAESTPSFFIKLKDLSQITLLLELLPDLERMPFADIKTKLIEDSMKWPIENVYSTEIIVLKRKAEKLGLILVEE